MINMKVYIGFYLDFRRSRAEMSECLEEFLLKGLFQASFSYFYYFSPVIKVIMKVEFSGVGALLLRSFV